MLHIRVLKPLALISFMLLIAGCGLRNAPEVETPRTPAPGDGVVDLKPLGTDEILSRISALPGQTLEDGTCGLFLWLRRDDAPLIFFQRSTLANASMILDGRTQSLPRTAATNMIAFNFFENQIFENEGFQLLVKAKAEAVRSIRQGIKIETGSISITTDDGWSAALPVAGVIGCK